MGLASAPECLKRYSSFSAGSATRHSTLILPCNLQPAVVANFEKDCSALSIDVAPRLKDPLSIAARENNPQDFGRTRCCATDAPPALSPTSKTLDASPPKA